MDRGEFQQDSVLKQLEVLKEEEKEFQNLKVSIPPFHPQPHDKMWLKDPPSYPCSTWPRWLHPKVLGTHLHAHHRAGSAHPSPSSAFCPCSTSPISKGHLCTGKDALVPTVLFAGPRALYRIRKGGC